MKNVIILGGGIAGLSTAFYLQKNPQIEKIVVIEKEKNTGGLCASINKNGYTYDIGPHIIFSKDKETLKIMRQFLNGNENTLRRSNKILYKNNLIQYPFENDLSKLPKSDLDYCINSFNLNPYENYNADNMLQFFLKTFGEGITNLYLRPYNEKIWKFDLAFMNTQMVERIPKPTKEEIKKSAMGETIDGYLHQLYFSYPSNGGIETLIRGVENSLEEKCEIITDFDAAYISKSESGYLVKDKNNNKEFKGDILISTIPIQELYAAYSETDKIPEIKNAVEDLKYNSIKIFLVSTKEDLSKNNFTFTIPDKDIIFHRISKMDFLGETYHKTGANYMVEITYRQGDYIDLMSQNSIEEKINEGLIKINFANSIDDIKIIDMTERKYAYVIYDLNHTNNMKIIRNYFNKKNIYLTGRFGNFEYWNMDKVISEAKKLSAKIIKDMEELQ